MQQASFPLTGETDFQSMLEGILESVFELLPGVRSIHVFLGQADDLAFGAAVYPHGHSPVWPTSALEIERGQPCRTVEPCFGSLARAVARRGQFMVIPDLYAHPQFAEVEPEWNGAVASLPLRLNRQLMGVMNVAYWQTGQVPEVELRALGLLAGQVAVAIEDVWQRQETHRRACELAALIEVGHDVSSNLDLAAVLERIATHARDLLEADSSEVYLLEPNEQTLRAIVALGDCAEQVKAAPLQLGEGIAGYVAQSWRAEMVNDIEQDPRVVHIPGAPEGRQALLCAPLVYRGRLIGVMTVARRGKQSGYSPFELADLDFLLGLSWQTAIAVVNTRLCATEQQRTAELNYALAQQRELDRLKDEFIQTVSHELRTPLTIILGYAELLTCGKLGELQSDQREPVAAILRYTRKLAQLVDNLTTLLDAEARAPRQELVDLADLVRMLLADFQAAAQRIPLTLVADIAPDVPPVSGNHSQLRRVLDNLLGNALKFTPPGGEVSVRVWRDGTNVLLEVGDTGIGISCNKLERIFECFYQADSGTTRRYSGLGLGLAVVKEVVEAHGGQVTVESDVGRGSTFRVRLPGAEVACAGRGGKIADDDP